MVGGEAADRAGVVLQSVGVMMESSREEEKGQGNQGEINEFPKQDIHPSEKGRRCECGLLFLFLSRSRQKGREK
jgi:hypothetical protein